jgi:hypothetical protein
MKITFSKEPDFYGYGGTPQYHSKCFSYRLSVIREGPVKKGKPAIEQWMLHFNPAKRKVLMPNAWIKVGTIFETRKQAVKAARDHDLFLRAEKAVQKKMKGKNEKKKGSRKSS